MSESVNMQFITLADPSAFTTHTTGNNEWWRNLKQTDSDLAL